MCCILIVRLKRCKRLHHWLVMRVFGEVTVLRDYGAWIIEGKVGMVGCRWSALQSVVCVEMPLRWASSFAEQGLLPVFGKERRVDGVMRSRVGQL